MAIWVFESYAGLLDEAETLEGYIRNELDCQKVNCDQIIQVARGQLLDEAQEYLRSAIESSDLTKIEVIEEKIRTAKKLSAAFQAAIASDEVGTVEAFKSFRNDEFKSVDIVGTTTEDKLVAIYMQNYENYGYEETAIVALVEEFKKKLQDPNSRLYIRRVGEKDILAFSLVTDNPESRSSYISGLNSNPELKGTKQGITTLGQIVEDNKLRGWLTTAEASPANFRGYGELEHGWVAVATQDDELGEEDYMLDIMVFPDVEFASKKLTSADIIKTVATSPENEIMKNGMIFWQTGDKTKIPPLDRNGRDFVITRSLQVTLEGKDKYVFVLEPNPHSATELQTQIAA